MRVDKYLWCVRYFKTRSIATQACKKGSVRVNEGVIKPSREVYPGDTIIVRKDQVNIYRTDTTPKEAFEKNELLKYSKEYYRKKGVGRPSKKDRRDITDFTNTEEE
jgi:ribosome-associated heat shock protein Hsp15